MTGLELGFGRWIVTVMIGSVLGLDGTSWPQVMVSRPIVAGTIGGWLFGDPGTGFLVGAGLELLATRHPPFGAARYPETGPAGLLAGAGVASAGATSLAPVLVALIAGWGIGWIGSRTVHLQRLLNERRVTGFDPTDDVVRQLPRRHRDAVRMDAIRAGLLTAAFLVPVMMACGFAARIPSGASEGRWTGICLLSALFASAGAGGRLIAGRDRWIVFATGAVAGLGLAVWGVAG